MDDASRIEPAAGGAPDGVYTQIAPDPDRDARRAAYADRERRRAARALDRYMEIIYGEDIASKRGAEIRAAGERFIEAVGDYVLSQLHHKSHYGVSDLCVHGFIADGQACGEFGCAEPAHSPDYGVPGE